MIQIFFLVAGVSVNGTKIVLQLLCLHKPNLVLTYLARANEILATNESNRPVTLSILWILSQSSFKDSSVGIQGKQTIFLYFFLLTSKHATEIQWLKYIEHMFQTELTAGMVSLISRIVASLVPKVHLNVWEIFNVWVRSKTKLPESILEQHFGTVSWVYLFGNVQQRQVVEG